MNNRLKELREKKNLSQTELAIRSGVSRVTINQIENGERPNIKTTTLCKLCDALHCKVSDFFCAVR